MKDKARAKLLGSVLLAVAVLAPCTGQATLITYEGFPYTVSSTNTLYGQPSNGTQASNGWDNVTWGEFIDGASNYTFLAGSLSDPSGKLVTSGNSVHAATTGTNEAFGGRYNVYTSPIGSLGNCGGGPTAGCTNANPTYYSILIRPDNLGLSNGTAFFDILGEGHSGILEGSSSNDLFAGYLFGGGYWGLQHGSTQVLSSVSVVSNQTVLLVVRGDYAPAGSNSTFLLYINPTPGAPEPATPNATYSFTQTNQQNGVALSVQNGAAATFDEIRVGTNYADVTPAVPNLEITAITRQGNDIRVIWNSAGGNTNVVQSTETAAGAGYSSNLFVDVSPLIVMQGIGESTTSYVDVGAAYAPMLIAPGGQSPTNAGTPSTVTITATNTTGLADDRGNAVSVGSLLMLGTFSISESAIQSNYNAGSVSAIMSAFTPYTNSFAVGNGTDNQPASWDVTLSAAGFDGQKMYLLAVDQPTLAAATQLGIYAAPSLVFPANGATTNIDLQNLTDFVIGAQGGSLTVFQGLSPYTFTNTARLSVLPGRIRFYRVRQAQ
jgi:hypothetical protein